MIKSNGNIPYWHTRQVKQRGVSFENIQLWRGLCNLCGKRVKEARQRNQITQEQLAARMQVEGVQISQKAVSRIESGERVVADYELLILSKVLGVPLEWLMGKD